MLYQARNLQFEYALGNAKVTALKDVDLNIDDGAFVCITGPSGSGKTTLLNLLGLVENVQSGSLSFSGRELQDLEEAQKNRIRRFDLGFVFQNFLLFPVLSAEENVDFFLASQGLPARERSERVAEAFAAVGLASQSKKRPNELSGGQRQRVAIARALAKRPKVIIADEPTASLDQTTAEGIMNIFAKLNADHGVSVIASSHDPLVLKFAKREIKLRDGQIVGGAL